MQLDRLGAAARHALALGIERRVDRRAGVHDEHVARMQVLRQVTKAGMGDELAAFAAHHQTHPVPREPARLGRLGRGRNVGALGPRLHDRGRGHAASTRSWLSVTAE
jgi:hypothetical protein